MATATISRPLTIRSAFLYDAKDLRIEQIAYPDIPPKHVSIAPKFCGICGSDLHFYHFPDFAAALKPPHPLTGCGLPIAFGHEFAGIVTELGEGCGSAGLAVGDRVAVMPTLTDGTCASCVGGSTNTCSQMAFVGVHSRTGGMSDRAIIREEQLVKLPATVGLDIGALIEPLAVAWHSVSLAEGLTSASSALILGGGPVGCAVVLALQAKGLTKIAVSEISADKRKFLADLGASITYDPTAVDVPDESKKDIGRGDGVDVVFDCAGAPTTLDTAILAVKPKGTIVSIATQMTVTLTKFFPMIMKELTLKTSIAYKRDDFEEVIAAIDSGRLNAKPLITKIIKLEDVAEEGLETLHRKNNPNCKILIDLSL